MSYSQDAASVSVLMASLQHELEQQGLYTHFTKVEMPVALLLSRLELTGMPFDTLQCAETVATIKRAMKSLEAEAHKAAGKSFKLSSFKDLSYVLYKHLRLPYSSHWKKKLSKEVLASLKDKHPLPGIILQYRKLHAALSKMILPLQKRAVRRAGDMYRVHPHCTVLTSTGRINMAEPSLQCVPKDMIVAVSAVQTKGKMFDTPLMRKLMDTQPVSRWG